MSLLKRATQEIGDFAVRDPLSGYYNNLAPELERFAGEEMICAHLEEQIAARQTCNPVSILQIGLAAWQSPTLSSAVFDLVVEWAIEELTQSKTPLAYYWDMPHTYELKAPWQSSMAFGQALSLLARASDQSSVQDAMVQAVKCLDGASIAARTDEGTVFQEYPTFPPAYVLNGWIWTLWGLHDAALVISDELWRSKAHERWVAGVKTLERRISLYEVGNGWSRYDLYPHRIRHWASPFYHRLHIAQLQATSILADSPELASWAERFGAGDRRAMTRCRAVCAKVLFRGLSPRRKHAP
jgi:hypothetical protein